MSMVNLYRLLLPLIAVALVGGCYLLYKASDDTMHASYATASEAREAGAITRGWMPKELPESAFDISETHNLDTNWGHGEFSFGEGESQAFRAKLQPVTAAQMAKLPVLEKLRSEGYEFHTVPGFALAVNWQKRHAHFLIVGEGH